MSFRFSAKNVFLTYARCSIEPATAYELLLARHPIKRAVVARELHEDGTPHLHALLFFTSKVDSRNQGIFDLLENHPNIQVPKNLRAVETYVKKDGDFFESDTSLGPEKSRDYFEIARSMTLEQLINFSINEKIPHAYMMMIWKMISDTNTIVEWDEQGEIDTRLLCYSFEDLYRGKALMIKGPTGIGKTTWAKKVAPKPCLMINHLDGLRGFRPGYHQSIIFDDMSFMHMPREAQIMITDSDNPRQIHVRYGVVNLPARIPKIFTTNVDIFMDDPAINRRYNKHLFA